MSKNNKQHANSTYETIRHMRGSWGNVKPVTKVIPNKKKDYSPLYDYYEEDEYEPGRYYWDEMEANP